jgi:Arc/MetJ-type ribon-helix-helix transcriptional regulator
MSRGGLAGHIQSGSINSHLLSGIDLIDLTRGEGEWRNMQDIIRRSFRLLFEQFERQQTQMNELTDSFTLLKKEQNKKMNSTEINSLIDSKMVSYARAASLDDMNTLRGQVTEIRSNLERKATIRYVDESLQRKANKSDLLLQHHSLTTAAASPNLSSQLIEQVNSKIFSVEQRMAAIETMTKLSSEHEQLIVTGQLNEIKSKLATKVDSKDLEAALLCRVERVDLDLQLHQKADRNAMNEVRVDHRDP